MSWSELERLVCDAESRAELRHTLRRCRSRQQLLRCAHRLGYGVTRTDLQNARLVHQQSQDAAEHDIRVDIAAGI
jgi:hypothetical protein